VFRGLQYNTERCLVLAGVEIKRSQETRRSMRGGFDRDNARLFGSLKGCSY
jgi:hypothetical protein